MSAAGGGRQPFRSPRPFNWAACTLFLLLRMLQINTEITGNGRATGCARDTGAVSRAYVWRLNLRIGWNGKRDGFRVHLYEYMDTVAIYKENSYAANKPEKSMEANLYQNLLTHIKVCNAVQLLAAAAIAARIASAIQAVCMHLQLRVRLRQQQTPTDPGSLPQSQWDHPARRDCCFSFSACGPPSCAAPALRR